jgi:hypothetical protein
MPAVLKEACPPLIREGAIVIADTPKCALSPGRFQIGSRPTGGARGAEPLYRSTEICSDSQLGNTLIHIASLIQHAAQQPTHAGPFRYSAFLSYSHTADSSFAAELQNSLQQFAKPYYARRAISIFRDQTDLSANPGLWSRIAAALDASEFFLLLASPLAASSKWVKRELDYWLTAHGGRAENLLLLWTDGDLAWDDAQKRFD